MKGGLLLSKTLSQGLVQHTDFPTSPQKPSGSSKDRLKAVSYLGDEYGLCSNIKSRKNI